jgi:hypothetical protein
MQSFLSPMAAPASATSTMATLPTQLGPADPVRAALSHLLSRAYSLPCSTAAQAFTQLVQPTSRFQLALEALLPLLDPNTNGHHHHPRHHHQHQHDITNMNSNNMPAEVCVKCVYHSPKRPDQIGFQNIMSISARTTDPRLFYLVLSVRPSPHRDQSIQVRLARYFCQRTRKSREYCDVRRGSELQRAIGVGSVENP